MAIHTSLILSILCIEEAVTYFIVLLFFGNLSMSACVCVQDERVAIPCVFSFLYSVLMANRLGALEFTRRGGPLPGRRLTERERELALQHP